MRELLEYLARLLVDHPEKVQVDEFEEEDGTLVLELLVESIAVTDGRDVVAFRM